MASLRKLNRGFTILGVVMSLIITASATVLIAHLVARAQLVASVSREKFMAINVAREGLELVRAVRDYNWFSSPDDNSQWMTRGLCEAGGQPRGQFRIDRQGAYNVVHNGQDLAGVTSDSDAQLYIARDGQWTHDGGGTLMDSPYADYFRRVMEIDCSAKDGDPPYVTVSSRVLWRSRGENREVEIKERLYNFRYVP